MGVSLSKVSAAGMQMPWLLHHRISLTQSTLGCKLKHIVLGDNLTKLRPQPHLGTVSI